MAMSAGLADPDGRGRRQTLLAAELAHPDLTSRRRASRASRATSRSMPREFLELRRRLDEIYAQHTGQTRRADPRRHGARPLLQRRGGQGVRADRPHPQRPRAEPPQVWVRRVAGPRMAYRPAHRGATALGCWWRQRPWPPAATPTTPSPDRVPPPRPIEAAGLAAPPERARSDRGKGTAGSARPGRPALTLRFGTWPAFCATPVGAFGSSRSRWRGWRERSPSTMTVGRAPSLEPIRDFRVPSYSDGGPRGRTAAGRRTTAARPRTSRPSRPARSRSPASATCFLWRKTLNARRAGASGLIAQTLVVEARGGQNATLAVPRLGLPVVLMSRDVPARDGDRVRLSVDAETEARPAPRT